MKKEEIKPLVWEEQKSTVTLTNEQWLQVRGCIYSRSHELEKDVEDLEDVMHARPDLRGALARFLSPKKHELAILVDAQRKIDAIR